MADPIIRQINEIRARPTHGNRVILFNDDHHSMDEVTLQIQKATGYSLEKAEAIMFEAHSLGQAVVYCGPSSDCKRVAGVLMQIGLRVDIETA